MREANVTDAAVKRCKYFYDTEFIDDGKLIHLVSLGIVCEDSREYYAQNLGCPFAEASDWVFRYVYPHLNHFKFPGGRDCKQLGTESRRHPAVPFEAEAGRCPKPDCPWVNHYGIARELRAFIEVRPEEPEFWGYYPAYDHVVLAQLYGAMVHLPARWPKWTRDIKQWCEILDDPELPAKPASEHHALNDARWVKTCHAFLSARQSRSSGAEP